MGYRINYEVKGDMAFLSHLEMMRLWQRALLRSDLPVSWTQGFNPRPKLSLGPAKGVGIEGLSEYLDVEFKRLLKGEEIIRNLNNVLPQGVHVLHVRELPPGTKLLEAVINEAVYRVTFDCGCPEDLLSKADAFMAEDKCLFIRHSPKKDKELDLRALVYNLIVEDETLLIHGKLGAGGAVRPSEILTVLGYWDIMKDINIQRVGLYIRHGARHDNP